jgi:hypothetical protein
MRRLTGGREVLLSLFTDRWRAVIGWWHILSDSSLAMDNQISALTNCWTSISRMIKAGAVGYTSLGFDDFAIAVGRWVFVRHF